MIQVCVGLYSVALRNLSTHMLAAYFLNCFIVCLKVSKTLPEGEGLCDKEIKG